ncbi:MAG: hypothetical protein PF693_09630 [Spirochaetia bacterium]|jgi:hypothetical protein|nr:hypothetical protein [Spirochaetia bacterium]
MGASVVLYRGIEKTIKNMDSSLDDKKDKIADLFIKSGFMLSADFMEDLYQYYLEIGWGSENNEISNPDQLRELGYHLVDVIDLFDMDYDENKDPLVLDEWITIKNLVSTYAEDIDDDLLTYIMQFAVEKGAFR